MNNDQLKSLSPMDVRTPRPTHLSDPFQEFAEEYLCEVLAKPDRTLEWSDYQNLLGPFLPAGTYEESVYFLPLAFEFTLTHPEDEIDLVSSLVWFSSEYAARLAEDGLLESARKRLRACFDYWTADFHVVHYDLAACRQKLWSIDHNDIVDHSQVVQEGMGDLVRFKAHRDLAESFYRSIAYHQGDPIRAAWFLELARLQVEGFKSPKDPVIQGLLTDPDLLTAAGAVVIDKLLPHEPSPTYWKDAFATLGF